MGKRAAGGCQCGAVRFEAGLPTLWCAHCHCAMCRRAHGAPYVTWVGVRAADFQLLAGENEFRRYRSSEGAERGFCGHCGSTILFESQRWPGEVHLTRANFDGEIDREPSGHAFFEFHADWAVQPAFPADTGGGE